MDDCASNLSSQAKQWFANMGSQEIWNLGYRQGFTFIGVAGRKDFQETRAVTKAAQATATQLFQVKVDLPAAASQR
jgi:hypothetical protein